MIKKVAIWRGFPLKDHRYRVKKVHFLIRLGGSLPMCPIRRLDRRVAESVFLNVGKGLGYGVLMGIWALCVLHGCGAAMAPDALGSEGRSIPVRQTGLVANPALVEASGMAHSRREADLLWMVNDGGHPAALFAVQSNGRDHGTVAVEGAHNTDWEDLAGFEWRGRPFLLIADVGDNLALRDTCRIYVVAEPARQATGAFPARIAVAWQFRFRYQDGPRDCEGVAVDTQTGRIVMITKRTRPPQLYTLPLHPTNTEAIIIARRVGEVRHIPPPAVRDLVSHPRFGLWHSQPTALDIRSDNRLAVVLTYKEAYLFPREGHETWAAALVRPPVAVPFPPLKQQETGCLSPDGRRLYVSTEQWPAAILEVDVSARP
jgi:hypothetical protein